jgi:hypothetical protein
MIFVRPPLPTAEPLYLGLSSIKIMEEGYISSASHNTISSAGVATAISETSSNSKTAKLLLPAGFEPTPNSVIIGRNKQSRNAPGTRSLIALAKKAYLPRYSQAESKREKTGIVTEIVKVIRAACPVGAFVTFDRGRWLEVGDLTAREKCVVVVVVTHTSSAGFEYFVLNKLPVSTIFPRSANNNRVGFVFRSLLQDRYRSSSKSKLSALKRRLDSQEDESSNMHRLLLLQGSTAAADRAGGMSPTPKAQPQQQDAAMTSLTAAWENHGRGTPEQPRKRVVSSPVVVRRDEESNHQDVCAPPKTTTSNATSSSILDYQHQTPSFMPPRQRLASSGGHTTISQEELSKLHHQLYISSFDSLSPLPLNNYRRYRRQPQTEEEQEYEDKKRAATIYGGRGVGHFRHDYDFCGVFVQRQDTYVSSSSTSSGVPSSSFFDEKETTSRTRESTPRGMIQRQRGDENCDKITTEEEEAATIAAAATSTTSRHGAPPSAPTASPCSNQNHEQSWRHCNVHQQEEGGGRLFLAHDQHLPVEEGIPLIPLNNSLFMLDACDLSDEDTVTAAIFD